MSSMHVRGSRLAVLLASLSVVAFASSSQAVIVNGDDSVYATAPAGLAGWSSIGRVNEGAAIYLGNGWVISAAHVNPGSVVFDNGVVGNYVAGTLHQLTTTIATSASTTQTYASDIILYQIDTNPGVAAVSLATDAFIGESLTMVGYGIAKPNGTVAYNVNKSNSSNWVWTATTDTANADYTGVSLNTSAKAKRWGTNTFSQYLDPGTGNSYDLVYTSSPDGSVVTLAFTTYFSNAVGNAQGYNQDSGGAVFNAAGELLGFMDGIDNFNNQPSATAIYGNSTFSAFLPEYADQIAAIIPEPSAVAYIAPLALALCRRRR